MEIYKFNLSKGGDYFVYVPMERHRTFREVASLLYSPENIVHVLSSKAILVRIQVDKQVEDISSYEEDAQEIIDRFSLLPLYILFTFDFSILLSNNFNRSVTGVTAFQDKNQFARFFQQEEMKRFIIESSAIIKTPNDRTYFRTPSQEYSHVFLRVGNIQTSRYVLDTVFFWALPYLKNAGSILTDSWSISSIALNIHRQLSRYVTDESAKKDIINNFHVNMLSTYYHGLRRMDKETRESLGPLLYGNEKKILCIISAVKTSKSLRNIRKAIRESGFDSKVEFLALYKLTVDLEEKCLCCLDDGFCKQNDVSFDSVIEAPEGSSVVPIDEQSFFPQSVDDQLITIGKLIADISREFFEEYGGQGVIYLHRNAVSDSNTFVRHHGIYVDILPMLVRDRFRNKLKERIWSLQKLPACIIHPPHTEAREIANNINQLLIEKFSSSSPKIFCFSELEIEPPQKRKEIEDYLKELNVEDWVLVTDDVSVTGARLHTYQKTLLAKGYRGKVCYLVGVARPESNELWNHRSKILTINGSKVMYVEFVILPDWNYNSCPWCQERQKLQQVMDLREYEELPIAARFRNRVEELMRNENKGLLNNAYVRIGSSEKPVFLGGSIFCMKKEITEADLVASIASSVQQLRNGVSIGGELQRLYVRHPFYSIINPHDYLRGDQKFFEPLIKASIIRSCHHGELYATQDTNRTEQKLFIKAFLEGVKLPESQQTFFIYELYLAMKLGKLPKPNIPEHLRGIINSYFTTGKAFITSSSTPTNNGYRLRVKKLVTVIRNFCNRVFNSSK